MKIAALYALAGAAIFSLAFYGLIVRAHLLRKILALNLMGSGIFLMLVSGARRGAPDPPDPVPHALVLTGIVVTVAATAFALALARRVYIETGRARLSDEE